MSDEKDPNRYIGRVNIPEGTSGEYKIRHIKKEAGAELPLGSMRTAMFAGDSGAKVRFRQETVWHELSYEGGVWMTDYPIEQYQMYRQLDGVYGRVYVGGLGLGCACNWLASLDEVDEIVCVEISPEVIELVKPHIVDPQGKVTVIEGDAHTWPMRYHKDPKEAGAYEGSGGALGYDVAFLDTWQRDGEETFFTIVKPFRELCEELGFADNVICWNEGVMRGQLYLSLHQRWMFSQNPGPVTKGFPSAEEMAKPKGTIYWDWQCPFWEKVVAGEVTDDNFQDMAGTFVRDF